MIKPDLIRNRVSAGILVALMCSPIQSHAHVPPECKALFVKAGRDVEKIVRKGQETSAMAMDGLEPGWRDRYHNDRYGKLSDLVAHLMGSMTFGFQSLAEAIACTDPAARNTEGQKGES